MRETGINCKCPPLKLPSLLTEIALSSSWGRESCAK